MGVLQLPHTAGCLVCGRENPRGLRLDLHVDSQSGVVCVRFTPGPNHIGFEGIIHGGVIATVLDEAMVWAATWAGKRFCVCAEMTVRFRREAVVGRALLIEAGVQSNRPRLVATAAEVIDAQTRDLVASGSGKYAPVTAERNHAFVQTLVPDPATELTAAALRDAR